MDKIKGSMDGQVEKVIDQAAGIAKEKVNEMIGGKKKEDPAGKGIGGVISGAVGQVVADKAKDDAAKQAMSIGKSLFK